MIVAEVSVVPLGVGTGVSRYVREAVRALAGAGLKIDPRAMATDVEARDLDELFAAVKKAHEAVIAAGAMRVLTTVKIDDRRDKEITIVSKIKAAAPR